MAGLFVKYFYRITDNDLKTTPITKFYDMLSRSMRLAIASGGGEISLIDKEETERAQYLTYKKEKENFERENR